MHSDALSFHTLQRIFLIVGTVGLLASLAMVWKFGITMSWLHAIALCCTSIAAGFIFPIRKFLSDFGAPRWVLRTSAVCGVLFIGLEGFSHVGYTIGMRAINTTESMVQTTAYEMRNDAVTEAKTKLAVAETRLKELKAANPWATSISPEKLKADIANMEGDMLFARSKQCANVTLKDSRSFCDQLAKLRGQLGTIEDYNKTAKSIEASQNILNQHRDTAIATKPGVSTVKAQMDFVSKLYLLASGSKAEDALKPDAVTLTVTDIIIGFFIAIGATLLPTVSFFLAFWKPEDKAAMSNIQSSDHTSTLTPHRPAHTRTTVGEQVRARMAAMALKAA